MAITKFNSPSLNKLRSQVEDLLNGADLGINFSIGRISYSEGEATLQLKVNIEGVQTKTETDLIDMAKIHNLSLKPNKKGEVLTSYNSNRPKYPWSYKTVRGTPYKCGTQTAKSKFS